MSAAQAREELEAAIWRNSGPYPDIDKIVAVLAAADNYAEAVADDRIHGHVTDRVFGPLRLETAVAESYGASR